MAINKVVYGNNTLIDLTEDTVSADKLLAGETAHDRSGAPVVGSVVTAEVVDNLTTQDATKALSAKQGYVLNQNKVDKVSGKGLSTNDYTNDEKTKLAGISAGAEPNVQSDWKQSDSSSDDFIKNKPTSDIKTSNDGQFTTVTGGLMQKCLIDLELIQDLHGYSKPWVGGAGKNKCNPDTFVQGLLNSSTGVAESNGSWITSDYISISDTITLSGYKDGTEANFCVRLCEYDANKTFIKNTQNPNVTGNTTWSRTITLDSNTRYVRTSVGFDNKATTVSAYFATNRLQIELGSQATGFEPYSNICPISGHTQAQVGNVGKNLFPFTIDNIKNSLGATGWTDNSKTISGVTFTILTDSANNVTGIKLNGTATATIIGMIGTFSLQGSYTINGCPSGGNYNTYRLDLRGVNADNVYGTDIGAGFGTTINQTRSLTIRIENGYTCNNLVFKPMIRLVTDTDATFEPYNGYTHVIDLGGTYYGGTLDAVSGVLTVTHGFKTFDGSEDEAWNLYEFSTGLFRAYIAISDIKQTSTDSDVANIVCNRFPTDSYSNSTLSSNYITGRAIAAQINVFETIQSTLANWRTWLASNPLQVAYELATPQTIQLDPQTLKTLVGQNDVFAPLDGQSVEEIEYREVMAFEDVPKAIPYECVAPDMGTGEDRTYFRIHRYGRVVVFTFMQDSAIEIVEQATRKIFGVLPERFYTKISGAMPYNTIKYTFINQNRFGVFVPKLLEIDPTNGNVYADYEADEGICPMGSLTYILDHD